MVGLSVAMGDCFLFCRMKVAMRMLCVSVLIVAMRMAVSFFFALAMRMAATMIVLMK